MQANPEARTIPIEVTLKTISNTKPHWAPLLRVRGVEKIHQPRVFIHTFNRRKIWPWNIQEYIENIYNTRQENYKYTTEIN